jgi:carbamoyl-phosphate synthase large subunit
MAKHKHLFLEQGITPIVSSAEFITICRDKRITNDFFLQNNIDIPKVVDKEQPTFPLYIKPYDGSLSFDTFLIKSESDLRPYHFENEKLMFMEYIDHDNYDEYTVDAYYDKNGDLKSKVIL